MSLLLFSSMIDRLSLALILLSVGTMAQARPPQFWGSKPFSTKFVTDRPSRAESSQTVEKGRIQIETDLVNHIYGLQTSGQDEVQFVDRKYLSSVFKFGLNASTDIEITTGWLRQKTVKPSSAQSILYRSQEDTTFRLKKNVYKSKDEKHSLAIMPTVTTSTGYGADDRVSGYGLVVPYDYNFEGPYAMSVTTSVQREIAFESGDIENLFLTAVSLQRELPLQMQGYIEWAHELSDLNRQSAMTFDAGLQYLPYDDIQFDLGCNFGLTSSADRLNPFVGFSTRF